MAPRRRSLLIALQALAGLVLLSWLVFFARREEYWGDEGFTVRRVEAAWPQVYNPFAVKPPTADPFDTRYVYDFNPPLYFAMIKTIAGPHPGKLPLRLFSILPALGIMALLGWRASRRFGIGAGAAVALALVVSPAIIYYGHEARPYALATFAAALLVVLYDRRPARLWLSFILNAIVALAGVLTHYHVVWLVGVLGVLYLVETINSPNKRKPLLSLGGLVAGTAIAVAIMLPVRYTFSATTSQASPPLNSITLLKMFFFPLMSQGVSRGVQFALSISAILLFCILAVRLVPKSRQALAWLALWLMASVAPILAHALFGQLLHERYAIFALPAFMMLLGCLIAEAWRDSRLMRALAAALVIAILANGSWWLASHANRPFRPPWSAAIANFYAQEKPGDYYSIQPAWLSLGFAANAPRPPNSTYVQELAQLPPAARTLWVIEQISPRETATARLRRAGWRVDPAGQNGVYWLWHAQKQ